MTKMLHQFTNGSYVGDRGVASQYLRIQQLHCAVVSLSGGALCTCVAAKSARSDNQLRQWKREGNSPTALKNVFCELFPFAPQPDVSRALTIDAHRPTRAIWIDAKATPLARAAGPTFSPAA
jgi:hypothetical protein